MFNKTQYKLGTLFVFHFLKVLSLYVPENLQEHGWGSNMKGTYLGIKICWPPCCMEVRHVSLKDRVVEIFSQVEVIVEGL